MNVACVSKSSLYRHIGSYVYPIRKQQWKRQQQLFNQLEESGDGLIVAGDGRCDSLGHSAKYGSFTLMEQNINSLVDFELVQVIISIYLLL